MRTSKIQNGRQGAPKWPTGSGKGSTPRVWGAPVNFSGHYVIASSQPPERRLLERHTLVPKRTIHDFPRHIKNMIVKKQVCMTIQN